MAANGDRPNRYPPMTPEPSGYPRVLPAWRDFTEAVTGRNHNGARERLRAGQAGERSRAGQAGERSRAGQAGERSRAG